MVNLLKFYCFSKSRHFSKKSFACGPNFRIAKNFAHAFGARLYVSIVGSNICAQYNQKLQKSCLGAKIGATLYAPFVNVSRVGFWFRKFRFSGNRSYTKFLWAHSFHNIIITIYMIVFWPAPQCTNILNRL